MNIKSLLLGSAAALVAVSGARAADAVVIAEPEPMEYVRVCDTYGVGFYYIPGTETCLRISGLLRYDIDYNDKPDTTTPVSYAYTPVYAAPTGTTATPTGAPTGPIIGYAVTTTPASTTVVGLDEGWAKTAYARLNIDARSETEYGTFRRFIRIDAGVPSGADTADVQLVFAYIELGGLLVGLYDTLYDYDLIPEFDQGGGSSAHQIRYTFDAGNGITVAFSVEEQDRNLDYTPNFGGRVDVAQGWGGLGAVALYDATTEETGVKGWVTFKATDMITLQAMGTWESGAGDFSVASGAHTGYDYSLAGAIVLGINEKLSISGGGQFFGDSFATGSDEYKVGGQVDYKVVENLLARVQVHYNGGDDQDFTDAKFRLESAF